MRNDVMDAKPAGGSEIGTQRAMLGAELDRLGAEVVHGGLFDFANMFRERRLRRADFLDSLEAPVFANVLPKWDAAEEIAFAGPYGSETIAYDAHSLRPYPFEPAAAAIVADFTGPQASIMPRCVLAAQVARAESAGFGVQAAFEFEFMVLDETAVTLRTKDFRGFGLYAPDNRCWSGLTAATFAPFVAELEALLTRGGIDLHALGVELGPGCFEATLRHKPAMRAADDAAFLRLFTKAFCRQRQLTACFMAYLGQGFPGLGGHVALSLIDKRTGRNAFADRNGEHGLSPAARSFLAGVIEAVPEAFPMFAHTVNSYRRFAPGSWAPKTVSWAPWSYAAALRTAAGSEVETRIECRLPGSDCNVYLALALLVGAGLDGIARGAALEAAPITTGGPSEIPDGVPRLPASLLEAAGRMRNSAKARLLFGEAFVDHFTAMCEAEDKALRRAVSPEEVRRYLESG